MTTVTDKEWYEALEAGIAKWDEFSRCTSLPHYWEIREENCELCRLDLRASRGAKAWRLFCSCCPVYSVTLQLSCSGISWPDADYARRNNDLPGFNEAAAKVRDGLIRVKEIRYPEGAPE
jgi:hypothetical protein